MQVTRTNPVSNQAPPCALNEAGKRTVSHEEPEAMLESCDGSFDPTAFRLANIDDRLHQIKLLTVNAASD
jgi:hypothetical protein